MSDAERRAGLDGLSGAARHALGAAAREARALGTARVGTEHLLLGLLAAEGSGAAVALRGAGVSPAVARRKVGETHQRATAATDGGSGGAGGIGGVGDEQRRSPRAERALNRAFRFANDQRSSVVRTEHLLLGLLDVEGTAGQVLRGLGTDVDALRARLLETDLSAPEPEPEPTLPEAAPDGPVAPPTCPSCANPLTHLTVSVVPAGPATATVYACPTCATALAVTPTTTT